MAKKKSETVAASGAAIDPAKKYNVKLKEAVKHGPTWLRPNAKVVLSGAALQGMLDKASSFYEVL